MIRQRAAFLFAAVISALGVSAFADNQIAKAAPSDPAASNILAFDTVDEIKAMPPVRATVRALTPCSADLLTETGTTIHLGSPKAPAEVVRFVSALKQGDTCDLPHAFVAFPALQKLDQTLTPIIQKHFPDAQFNRTTTQYMARHGTMEFHVHARSKTGEVYSKVHKEEGPNHLGFLLRIQTVPDSNPTAAAVPQELREPYWTTFIDKASLTGDAKAYFLISFSYGSRLDPAFQEAIRTALPSSLRPPK